MIRLEHVCVVHQVLPDAGRVGRTGIDKRPVEGPVKVGPLQLAGDEICDTKHHGGRFRAVYVVSDEDAAVIEAELSRAPEEILTRTEEADLRTDGTVPRSPGAGADRTPPVGWLGENFRVSGLSMSDVLLGERWRIGDVEIAFTEPRVPCSTFQRWVQEESWVRRFADLGRPGALAEVIRPGAVRAGLPVEVVHRPDHGLTIGEASRPSMPPAKAAALLASYAPEDIQPDMLRKARAAAAR
ncbi:MOSC domain-containing protein [Raineyella sp. LH-20]|uniref:MOSC domain-containing protein n=1 Tax=Raineyella sp. LH-20 TaxID=3081204 RepID=UPI00295302F7|nr:MOSC domain-containing protein [Raineyella sp. LH-20]WOP19526.1 MOSC domain-containing protein [Raineyella sp. LH-20]